MRNAASTMATAATCVCLVVNAHAADRIKLGFLTTLSGPGAVFGTSMRDGMALALEQLDQKLGGVPVELSIEDDQQKPENAVQIAEKYVKRSKVDFVIGVGFSNVMMAIFPLVTQSRTMLVSFNAGPSQIAGEQCSEYFFSTSWQGDNFSEALGGFLQQQGKQNIYLMAPNYQAGRDVLSGFKRFFKGPIAGEVYTSFGQLDFAAELAQIRATAPSAVFAFYPGGMGIQFVRQYAQSGLKDKIPLYTAYTLDNTTLPALGDAAMGSLTATFWNEGLPGKQNKQFVEAYRKKFGTTPAEYAAQAYDGIMLLDSAIRKVNGAVEDKAALINAMKAADFKSVRGEFKFNTNHFPIQNFYLEQVIRDADGKPRLELGPVILKDHGDAYAAKCPLK